MRKMFIVVSDALAWEWASKNWIRRALGAKILERNQSFEMLRRAKLYLALRSVEDFDSLLNLFPSLKFAHESMLPQAHRSGFVNLVVSEKGKARVADVARSHSIWLDPVDATKELYKHRLRINRIIKWAYKNNFVPILMTLTVYHRRNNLDGLNHVLGDAWRDLLSGYSGRRRAADVDLQGWIRRLEININDGIVNSDGEFLSNSGFHPHYHALLIVPCDKLELLSDSEQEWRDAWVSAVCKRFEAEFSEKVDESFLPAFREHGLVFSRVYDGDKKSYGALRAVDTGDYLAKIMGYDPVEIYGVNERLAEVALALDRDERTYAVYGIDNELASTSLKGNKIPFDLIRDPSLPAANVDLWVEYAIATKGVPAVQYSHGLEKRVNDYFEDHPQVKDSYKVCPAENVVASLGGDVYQLLYRNFKLKELYEKVAEGYDALCSWLERTFVSFGVPELCTCPIACPDRLRRPISRL